MPCHVIRSCVHLRHLRSFPFPSTDTLDLPGIIRVPKPYPAPQIRDHGGQTADRGGCLLVRSRHHRDRRGQAGRTSLAASAGLAGGLGRSVSARPVSSRTVLASGFEGAWAGGAIGRDFAGVLHRPPRQIRARQSHGRRPPRRLDPEPSGGHGRGRRERFLRDAPHDVRRRIHLRGDSGGVVSGASFPVPGRRGADGRRRAADHSADFPAVGAMGRRRPGRLGRGRRACQARMAVARRGRRRDDDLLGDSWH